MCFFCFLLKFFSFYFDSFGGAGPSLCTGSLQLWAQASLGCGAGAETRGPQQLQPGGSEGGLSGTRSSCSRHALSPQAGARTCVPKLAGEFSPFSVSTEGFPCGLEGVAQSFYLCHRINTIACQFKVQWIYWLVLIKLIEDIKPSQIGNKEIIDTLFGPFKRAFTQHVLSCPQWPFLVS